jgi:hypothetical protein
VGALEMEASRPSKEEAMNWSEAVAIVGFLAFVYFLRHLLRAWRSPEFKADLGRLRNQRRRRKEARR